MQKSTTKRSFLAWSHGGQANRGKADVVGLLACILLGLSLTTDHVRATGVRVKSLDVPPYVRSGEDVTLQCDYEIQNFKLYSIKWYRDGEEFFRYLPWQDPQKTVLSLSGASVNLSMSNGSTVVLMGVTLEAGGRYKCEVLSAEPEFHTADKSAPMNVVVIPKEKPTLLGTQHYYHYGDTVRLTCVSARSKPIAELTWSINNKEAPQRYLIPFPPKKYQDGLEEAKLGLEFQVTREHYSKGSMTLRCSAKIDSMYFKTQQHSVDGALTNHIPVMESKGVPAYSGSVGGSCCLRRPSLFVFFLASFTLLVSHHLSSTDKTSR